MIDMARALICTEKMFVCWLQSIVILCQLQKLSGTASELDIYVSSILDYLSSNIDPHCLLLEPGPCGSLRAMNSIFGMSALGVLHGS